MLGAELSTAGELACEQGALWGMVLIPYQTHPALVPGWLCHEPEQKPSLFLNVLPDGISR